ncbi:hypothetical protein AB0A63_05040 [Lentzea sp. NPDC042327]|uniref:PIN-like domain-containing protein n=1 Tax=Lentzea sp. NPDC042327 TaxID=3154801 RepID=UPI00340160D2
MSSPEFFLDRSLGRGVAEGLARLGWTVHRITDHFPDDAQFTADDEWLEYGLDRGWVPLCKDGRIKGRPPERRPVEDRLAVLFYLDNQQLRRDEMISRFHNAQAAIHRAVTRGGPAIYAVKEDGIRRTWP